MHARVTLCRCKSTSLLVGISDLKRVISGTAEVSRYFLYQRFLGSEIYVDPDSQSNIEIGTKENPFKVSGSFILKSTAGNR